jgi:transcription elongation factor Elf1
MGDREQFLPYLVLRECSKRTNGGMLDNTGKEFDRRPDCPRCKGESVVKNGKQRGKKQRWLCKDCDRRFTK